MSDVEPVQFRKTNDEGYTLILKLVGKNDDDCYKLNLAELHVINDFGGYVYYIEKMPVNFEHLIDDNFYDCETCRKRFCTAAHAYDDI